MSGLTFEEMYGWRNQLKNMLLDVAKLRGQKVHILNPCDYYNFKEVRHQSESEIMDYDINHVITSDIVVVNIDGLNTSDGTKIEIHRAWLEGIPVIAFGEKDIFVEMHPWIKRCVTRIEKNMSDVCDYISEFYMF